MFAFLVRNIFHPHTFLAKLKSKRDGLMWRRGGLVKLGLPNHSRSGKFSADFCMEG